MGEFLGRMRTGLLVVGAVLTVVGVLGLAFGWGSSSTTTVRSSAETPQAFLSLFVAALRSGNSTFLFERLDPTVIACGLNQSTQRPRRTPEMVTRLRGCVEAVR